MTETPQETTESAQQELVVDTAKETANALIKDCIEVGSRCGGGSIKNKILSTLESMQYLQEQLKNLPENPDIEQISSTLNPANSYKHYLINKLNLPDDFDFEQEFKKIHDKKSGFSRRERELILKLEEMQQQQKDREEGNVDESTKQFIVDLVKRIHEQEQKKKEQVEQEQVSTDDILAIAESVDDMKHTVDEAADMLKDTVKTNEQEKETEDDRSEGQDDHTRTRDSNESANPTEQGTTTN